MPRTPGRHEPSLGLSSCWAEGPSRPLGPDVGLLMHQSTAGVALAVSALSHAATSVNPRHPQHPAYSLAGHRTCSLMYIESPGSRPCPAGTKACRPCTTPSGRGTASCRSSWSSCRGATSAPYVASSHQYFEDQARDVFRDITGAGLLQAMLRDSCAEVGACHVMVRVINTTPVLERTLDLRAGATRVAPSRSHEGTTGVGLSSPCTQAELTTAGNSCMPAGCLSAQSSEYGPRSAEPVVMLPQAGMMGAGQAFASASHCNALSQGGMPTESTLLHADLSMPAKVGRLNVVRICTAGQPVTSYIFFSCSTMSMIFKPNCHMRPTVYLCSGCGAFARPGHLPPRHQA